MTNAAETAPREESGKDRRLADVLCHRGAESALKWPSPRTFGRPEAAGSIKAVQMCPAVLDYEKRLVEVLCPVDATLRVDGNNCLVEPVDGSVPMPEDLLTVDWSNPRRPRIQIETPFTLTSGEELYAAVLPPLLQFRTPALPGLTVTSRQLLGDEPVRISWTFDWRHPDQELILRRDEPLLYLRFETKDPSRPVRLTLD